MAAAPGSNVAKTDSLNGFTDNAALPNIHLALPKGHMQENVSKLFEDAGIKVRRAR